MPLNQVSAKLKKNVQANPFPIKIIDTAISDSAGVATFYDTETHNYTASLNSSHGANTVEYQVKTQTLDSFIEENQLKVDLLKIDVERHEPQVMEGFQKYLRLQQPSILMEILDEEVGRAVQQLIAGVPYLYFSLHESGTIRRVDQLTKSDDYNYLICREEVAKNIGLI